MLNDMTDNFIPVFTNLLVDPYEFNPYEKKAAADEFEIRIKLIRVY